MRLANVAFPKRFFDSSAWNVTGQPAPAAPPPADDLLPEGPAKPEDDIARLGAAFYRCVTGREPASAAAPARARGVAPDVPIDLADLIDHLVDPDPGRRPPTAAAVAAAHDIAAAGPVRRVHGTHHGGLDPSPARWYPRVLHASPRSSRSRPCAAPSACFWASSGSSCPCWPRPAAPATARASAPGPTGRDARRQFLDGPLLFGSVSVRRG